MRTRVGQKARLVNNVLFLEGITRSGKFLLANILSGFEKIEPIQYQPVIEHIPYLVDADLIDRPTAIQLLQCEVDLHSYEMFIGRNFNLRLEDKSTIYNHPNSKFYLNRSKVVPREKLVKELLDQGVYSSFILHETMPNIKIILKAFPESKIVSIRRDPVDLAYSWYMRGFGKRWGHDPALFQIPFHSDWGPVPWFARTWAEEYCSLDELNRVIKSIIYLWEHSENSYSALVSRQKNQIVRIKYEDILEKPLQVVTLLESRLQLKSSKIMSKIFENEHLPNPVTAASIKNKLEMLQSKAVPMLLKQLLSLQKEY